MIGKNLLKYVEIFKNSIDDNINNIDFNLKDIGVVNDIPILEFKKYLNFSSQMLVDKWNIGRKHIRTKQAFNIIDNYPENLLPISIALDAIVNILDDLIDDDINKQETGKNILELIRNIALITTNKISDSQRDKIAKYFNKGLCIAISESIYANKIKNSNDFNTRVDYAIKCYNCKSLVVDIFYELPLIALYDGNKNNKIIIEIARINRALQLIKKDLDDKERDIFNNTETPIVLLPQDNNHKLEDYLLKVINYYKIKIKKYNNDLSDKSLNNIKNKLIVEVDKNINLITSY